MSMEKARAGFESAVINRMKEGGFLEIEVRTECLIRSGDGYQDDLINYGWWAWQQGQTALAERPNVQAKANVHMVQLKTRKEMEKTIPRDMLGWWHDVCPGQRMTLRDATASDLTRCTLAGNRSKDPNDYLCELPATGSLVSKIAIKHCSSYVIDAAIAQQGKEEA